MILTISKRALLGAMIFQAKKDPRYYLNGICFHKNGKVYSTNGHCAFIGEHETKDLNETLIVNITTQRITKFDVAKIDTKLGVVFYENDDGVRVGVGLCELVEGNFPDIERVIPTGGAPVSEIGFNAGYLAAIEKTAKLYNPKWPGIVIKTNGNINSSVIDINCAYGNARVVIMPMRITD